MEDPAIEEVNAAVEEENEEEPLEEEVEEVQESQAVEEEWDESVESVNTSVQIAPTSEEEDDESTFVQLGDRILIRSHGADTYGIVYYRSEELIRIRPEGASNILRDFAISRTEEGGEVYEEGVTDVFILQKRIYPTFVAQHDFRVGQLLDTYDEQGTLYKTYKVTEVHPEEDTLTVHEQEDPETVETLSFDGVGIPMDLPFIVIGIRANLSEENGVNENGAAEEEEEQKAEEDIQESKPRIKLLGIIEIIPPKILRKAESHEQQIPEQLQKMDAFNDFMRQLDSRTQKDIRTIRSIRILVETLNQLKHDTISYRPDGTVESIKLISPTMIYDLLFSQNVIPLGRPVLHATKNVYDVKRFEEEHKTENRLVYRNLSTHLENEEQHRNSYNTIAKSEQHYWTYLRTLLDTNTSPYHTDKESAPYWTTQEDTEFFRELPPSTIPHGTMYKLEKELIGLVPSNDPKGKMPPQVDFVAFGMERALGPSFRKGSTRSKQLFIEGVSGSIQSYLLFPLRVAPYLGKKFSSMLAMDSGRSKLPLKTMRMILEEIGGPVEKHATANDLLIMGVQQQMLGNIPLADYLEGLPIPALGLGDTFTSLEQLGLNQMELNIPIATALLKTIQKYQIHLISALSEMRTVLENAPAPEIKLHPLFSEPSFMQSILSQPLLNEAVKEYEMIHPRLASLDLGKVAFLMKNMSYLFQVTAGKQALLIKNAVIEEINLQFIRALHIEELLRYHHENSAPPPRRNRCSHVADLVAVHRIKNDTERFYALSLVYRKYQGIRTENWVDCNLCNEHFVCIHERLQLDVYYHPKEKDVIEKEILLKCSGGIFQGNYICRNCGQPLREMDLDRNIEFDDEGRPKYGVSQLVDEDEKYQQQLNEILNIPFEPSEQNEMNLNEEEKKCYHIIKELADTLGIVKLDQKSYRAIIDRVLMSVSKFSRTMFDEQYRSKLLGQKGEKSLAKNRERDEKTLSNHYKQWLALYYVTYVAASMLLDIQMKIPNYFWSELSGDSESVGFGGYPLAKEKGNLQGVTYMANGLLRVNSRNQIWKDTKLSEKRQSDPAKALDYTKTALLTVLSNLMMNDPLILANLEQKRLYLADLVGQNGEALSMKYHDRIFPTFLPELMISSSENAAEDVISPEIAEKMGAKGQLPLVKLWIRTSHRLAMEHTILIHGSPFSEMTGCVGPIQSPMQFWQERMNSELPRIAPRKLIPNRQGSMLVTHFEPRHADVIVPEPNSSLYHRVFLKYCFTGPFEGYPHEFGLTSKCRRCGFQFVSHLLRMDPDVSSSSALEERDAQGYSKLEEQEVKVNVDTFTQLLDSIHRVNEVTPATLPERISTTDVMQTLGAIDYVPFENWGEIIYEIMNELNRLPPDATQEDIRLQFRTIAENAHRAEQDVYASLNETQFQQRYSFLMKNITELSWSNFFQVIHTYFITIFSRLLNGFLSDSLYLRREYAKVFSDMHNKDIDEMLKNELNLVTKTYSALTENDYALATSKISYLLYQWNEMMSFKNKIREKSIPGGAVTLMYIKRALFFGPLSKMFDPDFIPSTFDGEVQIADPSFDLLKALLFGILDKYKEERLAYNDQLIQMQIAIHAEKERVFVVKMIDDLSPDGKQSDLIQKSLGIGRWAVGGSKSIYKYSADRYNVEKLERIAAGIEDYGERPGGEGYDMDLHAGNHDD